MNLMRRRQSARLSNRRRPSTPPAEQIFPIQGEYITLGQLLKIAGVIGTGGEAKLYLAETVVQVNGEPEQRRGRKLRPGDRIVPPGAPPIRLVAGETPEADTEEDDLDV